MNKSLKKRKTNKKKHNMKRKTKKILENIKVEKDSKKEDLNLIRKQVVKC